MHATPQLQRRQRPCTAAGLARVWGSRGLMATNKMRPHDHEKQRVAVQSGWPWPHPAPEGQLMGITKAVLQDTRTNPTTVMLTINLNTCYPYAWAGMSDNSDHGPSVPHTATWMNPLNSIEAYSIHPSTQRQTLTIT